MIFTTDMAQVLHNADMIVESVTSAGIRPVFRAGAVARAPFLSDYYYIQRDRTRYWQDFMRCR